MGGGLSGPVVGLLALGVGKRLDCEAFGVDEPRAAEAPAVGPDRRPPPQRRSARLDVNDLLLCTYPTLTLSRQVPQCPADATRLERLPGVR
jgi:hypothetical protein